MSRKKRHKVNALARPRFSRLHIRERMALNLISIRKAALLCGVTERTMETHLSPNARHEIPYLLYYALINLVDEEEP